MGLKSIVLGFFTIALAINSTAQDAKYLRNCQELRSADLKELPDSLQDKGLIELAKIFNTDKQATWHNFIDTYDRNFSPIQDSVKRILEIGIFNGAIK